MAESRSIRNVELFSPSVQIRFHTQNGAFEVRSKSLGQEQSLVSCQTFKDIGQPTGTFTVHLTDNERYDKYLHPMDMCTIKMSNHSPLQPATGSISESRDQLTHATMIGFIDSVRRKRLIDPTSGKPQVFCEIRGRDFGKIFVKHQVRYIPWLAGDDISGISNMVQPVVAMFKELLSGFITGGEIDFIVANNLRKFLSHSVKMTFKFGGQDLPISDCISFRAQSKLGIIPYNLPLQAQEGSFWQVLGNFANLPFNEMWVDTINNPERVISKEDVSAVSSSIDQKTLTADQSRATQYIKSQTVKEDQEKSKDLYGANGEKIKMAQRYNTDGDMSNACTMLFLRRTPFDDSDWRKLPRYSISESEIVEQDIGSSDNEAYNMFWVYPLLAIPNDLYMKGLGARPLLFTQGVQWSEKPNTSGNNRPSPIQIAPPVKKVDGKNQDMPPLSDRKQKDAGAADAYANAVEKYGLLPMELRTRVWKWAESTSTGDAVKVANILTCTIANWYKRNSLLLNGSMTIKGSPDLHVGNVLANTDDGMEYYVEGVSNSYIQYQPMTTTVMLTRGQPAKDRADAFVWGDAYTTYTGAPSLKVGSQEVKNK
jgi:hypothetical protein